MIDFIKDADCTKETPVKLGVPDAPIYGKGIKLKPRVDGRTDSEHFKKIYLPELLPLEEYDLIVVLISGGKDSVACYLKLLELGVPKERIEFWHHDIDGGHPSRRMDWKCTQNYVKALADAEGIKLRVSYRVNGFFGELYRIGASEPIEWIDPDTGEVKQCKLSSNYLKCKELKEQATEEMEELLKKYGYRMKFPAKTGDLSRRWCSAYLKICVADTVVSNLDRLGELEELGGNFILQGAKAHMTDLEFLEKEIAAWKCSPRRMMQIKGFLYYDGDHDVIHRKRTMIGEGGELEVVENLPNNRIVDNQYAKMVNQKANYLFGKP